MYNFYAKFCIQIIPNGNISIFLYKNYTHNFIINKKCYFKIQAINRQIRQTVGQNDMVLLMEFLKVSFEIR